MAASRIHVSASDRGLLVDCMLIAHLGGFMSGPFSEPRLLRSLKANLKSIECEIPSDALDQLAEWSYRPVALVYELQGLAGKALEGDEASAGIMFQRIESHARSHGEAPRGDIDFGPRGGGPIPQPIDPCGPSPLPGPLGEIALAVSFHTQGDSTRRGRLLDGLEGLAFCTETFDGLVQVLDAGEIDSALDRVRAMRDEADPRTMPRGRTPNPDGPEGGFPIGGPEPGDPFPIPNPCPPPVADPCNIERDFCYRELIDYFRNPPQMPDGSHVYATGITGVSANVCAGDTIRITGSGFGLVRPLNVRVVVAREVDGVRRCEAARVISWTDRRIEVEAPAGVVTGCVGFLDLDELANQQNIARQANIRIDDLNSLSVCLRAGPITRFVPLPSEHDCPPCVTVNRLVAGPPVIRSFRGVVMAGSTGVDLGFAGESTIEPGQDLELRWDVENATKVKLARTSGKGPRFGNANSITDPPGNSYDLGAAAHNEPEVWRYKLTATNRCGSVDADIVIAATSDPGLTFGSAEVTQGIQTVPPTVALVAEKQTVVRVFWNHGLGGFDGDSLADVTGTLRVRRNGAHLGVLHPINGASPPAAVAGASITLSANPLRANVDDSLNFLIPAAWSSDTLDLFADVKVDDYGAAPGHPGSGFTGRAFADLGAYTFATRTPINLEYLRIRWRGSDNTVRTPSTANCERTLVNSLQRIAAPLGSLAEHPDSPLRPGGTHDADDMEDMVDDWDFRHRCEIRDAILGFTGMPPGVFGFCFTWDPDVINAVGEAYWALMPGSFYGGIAADIPASTYSTPARTATDTNWTATNLDTKAAHELSHCLDQLHIELCGARGGEGSGELSNNSAIQDVGFDIDGNNTVTNATDIMSYCNPRWTHPDRWARVYGYVGG